MTGSFSQHSALVRLRFNLQYRKYSTKGIGFFFTLSALASTVEINILYSPYQICFLPSAVTKLQLLFLINFNFES